MNEEPENDSPLIFPIRDGDDRVDELARERSRALRREQEQDLDVIQRSVLIDGSLPLREIFQQLGGTQTIKGVDLGMIHSDPLYGMRGVRELTVYLFWVRKFISALDLYEQYRDHGLRPSLRAQATLNLQDRRFPEENANALQFLYQDHWAYASFLDVNGVTETSVVRDYTHQTGGRRSLRNVDAFWVGGIKPLTIKR